MTDKHEALYEYRNRLQKSEPKDFPANLEKFLAAALKVEARFQTRCRKFKDKKAEGRWFDKLTGKIKLDDDMLMQQAEFYEKQTALFMAETTCELACDFDPLADRPVKFDEYYRMNDGSDGLFLHALTELKAMAGFKDASFEGGDEFLRYCCNLNLVKAVYWYYVAAVHGNPRAREKLNDLICQNCLAELSAVFDESFLGTMAADPKSPAAKAKALQLELLQGSLHEIFKGEFKGDIEKFLFVWNCVAGTLNGSDYGSKLKLFTQGKRSQVSYLPYAYLALMARLLNLSEDLELDRLKNSKFADYQTFLHNLGMSLFEMINSLLGPGEAERFEEMEQRFARQTEARRRLPPLPSDLICSEQDAENYDPLYLICNLLKNLASLRCFGKSGCVKPLLIDESMFGMPPHAAYLIGLDCIQGKNLPKNLVLGLNFLRYAHACGHPYAAASLAFYQEELPGTARNGKSLLALTDAVLSSIYNIKNLIEQSVAPVAVFDPEDLKHDDANPLLLLCASYFDMLSTLAKGQELFGYSLSDRRRIFSEQSLYAVKGMMSAMHRPEYEDVKEEQWFADEDDDADEYDDDYEDEYEFEDEEDFFDQEDDEEEQPAELTQAKQAKEDEDAGEGEFEAPSEEYLDGLFGPRPEPAPAYSPAEGRANLCEIALVRLCSCGTALPYDYYSRLVIMLRQMVQDRFDNEVPGRRRVYDPIDSDLIMTIKDYGYFDSLHEGMVWGRVLSYAERFMAKVVFDSPASCPELKAYYLSFWLRHAVYFPKEDYERVSHSVRERFDEKTLNEILDLPGEKFASVFYELAMALKGKILLFDLSSQLGRDLYGKALKLSGDAGFGPALGQGVEDFLEADAQKAPSLSKEVCASLEEGLEISRHLISHGCIGQGLSLAKEICKRLGDEYQARCYDRLDYEYRSGKREAYKADRALDPTFIDSYFDLIKCIKSSGSVNYADDYAALISFLPLSADEIACKIRDFAKSRAEDDPCSMEAAMFLNDYDLNQCDGGAKSSPAKLYRRLCTPEGGLADSGCRLSMASYRYRLGPGLQSGAGVLNDKAELKLLNKMTGYLLDVIWGIKEHPGPLAERMRRHLYSSNLFYKVINRFGELSDLYSARLEAMSRCGFLSDAFDEHFAHLKFEKVDLFNTQVPLKRSNETSEVNGLISLLGPVFTQEIALNLEGPLEGSEVLAVRMQMHSFLVPIDAEALKSDCLKSFNGADAAAGVFGSLHEKFWTVPALKAGAMTYSEDQADYFSSVVSSQVKQ